MTIQRDDFLRRLGTNVIDLARAREDAATQATLREAGLSVNDLARADLDGDGRVDAREAWRLADGFDRDGVATSVADRTPAGVETRAGATIRVAELLAQHPGAARANPRAPNDPALTPGGGGRAPAAPSPRAPRPNDEILHVGMGVHAADEVKHLRGRGAKVTTVGDSTAGDDRVKVGNRTYDLTTDGGVDDFVKTLRLPAEQSTKVADAIRSGGADARDELAGIDSVWAKGERGEPMPSRMVISGHHVGSAVWGDTNGRLTWDSMKQLSDAMPRASAQVEDLHIAACYSGGAQAEEKYKSIFPNAKTIWAYSGSAPGTWSGAMPHLSAWETATRGRGTDVAATAQRLVDRGVRKADHIDARAVGSARTTGDVSELRERVAGGDGTFASYFTGARSVTDTQSGPLREYYGNLQSLLQHPGLGSWERQPLEERRDQTIRTIFYDSNVRGRFQQAYGAEMGDAFASVGLARPNFATMSRAEALDAIRSYRARYDAQSAPSAAQTSALGTLNGLWNLDPRTIPEGWL